MSAQPETVAETARTRIRLWRPDEADRMLDMHRRWEVARWLGAEPRAMQRVDEAHAQIARWADYAKQDSRYGLWAVEDKDAPPERRVAGSVLLMPLPLSASEQAAPDGPEVEIGWHLHPDAWARGLATEPAEALLAKAWADGHDAVFAVMYSRNTASRRVCERLGMAPIGQTARWYGVTFDAYRIDRPLEPPVP